MALLYATHAPRRPVGALHSLPLPASLVATRGHAESLAAHHDERSGQDQHEQVFHQAARRTSTTKVEFITVSQPDSAQAAVSLLDAMRSGVVTVALSSEWLLLLAVAVISIEPEWLLPQYDSSGVVAPGAASAAPAEPPPGRPRLLAFAGAEAAPLAPLAAAPPVGPVGVVTVAGAEAGADAGAEVGVVDEAVEDADDGTLGAGRPGGEEAPTAAAAAAWDFFSPCSQYVVMRPLPCGWRHKVNTNTRGLTRARSAHSARGNSTRKHARPLPYLHLHFPAALQLKGLERVQEGLGGGAHVDPQR